MECARHYMRGAMRDARKHVGAGVTSKTPSAFHEPDRPLAFLDAAYPALSTEGFDYLLTLIDEAEKADFSR
jgi:hypothetical protein